MAQVKTNNIALAYARELTPGVLPGSPIWRLLEPNNITRYGARLGTVARAPISSNRQARKGSITDLDAATEFEADVTFDHLQDFTESFLFAQFVGPTRFGPVEARDVTAVTGTGYTVTAGSTIATGALVYARGFTNAANNGLKVVTGGSGTEVQVAGLVAEGSPPANAVLEVAGVQGASGDIQLNASGNLISTVLDFTTLSLTVGQFLWVGGDTAGTSFATAGYRGYARISAIAANLLTLSKRSWTVGAADNGAGKTIHLFFGQFCRNVAVGATDYIERSIQFEASFPDLGGVGVPEYEYAVGNFSNEVTYRLATATKAVATWGFVGTDVEVPTTTRKTGAATPLQPLMTTAINTTSDIARLRVTESDETLVTSFFRSCDISINNNVTPEKVIGLLGAAFINIGNLAVTFDAQVLFSTDAIPSAIRQNRTMTMEMIMRQGDGAYVIDIPSLTLAGGDREYPINETVRVQTTGTAFQDATLGTSMSTSKFPYAPAA